MPQRIHFTVKFTLDEIKKIMQTMQEHGVTELSLQGDENQLTLKREHAPLPAIISAPSYPANFAPPYPNQQAALPMPAVATPPEAPKNNRRYITSPMVGTFYSKSSPDKPVYLQNGQDASVGQVVCIIEAMKVMNEVKGKEAGKVVEVLVKEGQPVEFGTKLFALE